MSDLRRRALAGLCDNCAHQRLVPTRTSVFTMCEAEGLPRYPAVPVMRCRGFVEKDWTEPTRES